MKTWETWAKVFAGCSVLACVAVIGLVALILALPEPTPEQRAQWETEDRQRREERREREEQDRQAEQERLERAAEERLERAARAAEEARARLVASFFGTSLTQHVLHVHYGAQDSSLGMGKLFPARWSMEWEAVQVIDASDGRRYAIYRLRGDRRDIRFAARLTSSRLPLLGTHPESGCYRYLGLMEGKGRHGIVPFMVFEREPIDDPLCTG